jgi:hypothetical protein
MFPADSPAIRSTGRDRDLEPDKVEYLLCAVTLWGIPLEAAHEMGTEGVVTPSVSRNSRHHQDGWHESDVRQQFAA